MIKGSRWMNCARSVLIGVGSVRQLSWVWASGLQERSGPTVGIPRRHDRYLAPWGSTDFTVGEMYTSFEDEDQISFL